MQLSHNMSIVGLDVGMGSTDGVNETEGFIDKEGNWECEAEGFIEGIIDEEGNWEDKGEGLIEGLMELYIEG